MCSPPPLNLNLVCFCVWFPGVAFAQVEKVLSQLGLTDERKTKIGGALIPGLSGGQKKRAAIGCELITLPRAFQSPCLDSLHAHTYIFALPLPIPTSVLLFSLFSATAGILLMWVNVNVYVYVQVCLCV